MPPLHAARRLVLLCGPCLALSACAGSPPPEPLAQVPAPEAQAPAPVPLAQSADALLAGTALALGYSGYRVGQHPDKGEGEKPPSRAELLEDMQILTRDGNFGLIRVYGSGDLTAQLLELIEQEQLPMKVMLGAWLEAELSSHEDCAWLDAPIPQEELDANTVANAAEVQRAIALANKHPDTVVAVNVGNEALVTWNDHLVSIEGMVAYVQQVQAAVDQPVTTADNYLAWVQHADALGPVVDFVSVHTYPQWEGKTIDEAMPYTLENMQAVRDALPDAQLSIGEAGWTSVADEFGERASEAQQARYYNELTAWAAQNNITTFVFEAFDEPWKGAAGAPMGAEKHWGLFDVERQPKQVMRSLYSPPDAPPESP